MRTDSDMSAKAGVLERFLPVALPRQSGELYLRLQDSLVLLATCRESDLAVFTIEGVLYDGQYIRPRLDMIAHCGSAWVPSWRTFRDECNRDAQAFFDTIQDQDDLWFIVDVISEEEWAEQEWVEEEGAALSIRALTSDQRPAVAGALARAFYEDPFWVWAIPDGDRRRRVQAWFFPAAVNYGMRYGRVYTDEAAGCGAMWLPPGDTDMPVLRLMRVGLMLMPLKAGLPSFSRLDAMGRALDERHKLDVQGDHWYLWLLGVDPPRQGQGLGSRLVRPVLDQADAGGVACYLDTTLERNLTFYRRLGFEVAFAGQIPKGGPPFWTLRRDPKTGAA
jgi:ribosomal protein S18 acetylase RimI-like enzyme